MSRVLGIFKQKKFVIIAIVVIIIFVLFKNFTSNNSKTNSTSQAPVEKRDIESSLILSGELVADKKATLQFQSSGQLAWVGVIEGQKVTKGQAIAKLDTVALNSAYQKALSNLRAEEANVQKIHDDLKNKDKSETFAEKVTRVEAEVAKDNAYENMITAQKALRDATIVAPFSGIVTQITNAVVGANIMMTSTSFEIIDPTTIHFEVEAEQTEVNTLKPDDKVTVTLDAFPDKKLDGKINYISFSPKTGEAETLYEIKIELSEYESIPYKIGMTGDMSLILEKKENVLAAPSKYIKSDKDGKYAIAGPDKKKVKVETGLEGDEYIEIKEGSLQEGTVLHD